MRRASMKRTAPLDDSEGTFPATEGKKRVVIASPPVVNHPGERASVTAAKPVVDDNAFLALRRFAGATVALPGHEVVLGRPCEADASGTTSAKLDVGLTELAKVISRTHCTLGEPDVAAGTVELRSCGANPCVVLRGAAAAAAASGIVARDAAEHVKVAKADGAPTHDGAAPELSPWSRVPGRPCGTVPPGYSRVPRAPGELRGDPEGLR